MISSPALQLWPSLIPWIEKETIDWVDVHFAYFILCPFLAKKEGSLEMAAFFLSYLFSASRKGNLCIKIFSTSVLPEVDPLFADKVIKGSKSLPQKLIQTVSSSDFFPQKLICQYEKAYYLQKFWVYENQIYSHIKRLQNEPTFYFFPSDELSSSLNKEQKQAIEKAFRNPITFILGGPGTGKTFTAAHLLSCFTKLYPQKKWAVAAPTGKAAFELQQKIPPPSKAFTLHSLLQIHPKAKVTFQKTYLPYDFYLIDEASMIDVKMMAYLLCQVKPTAKMIFMGDPNQLPSVEAGSIFSDLCVAFPSFCAPLKKAIRFEKNELYTFSQAVLQRDKSLVNQLLTNGSIQLVSWKFSSPLPPIFLEHVKQFYITSLKEPTQLLQKQSQFRILSPLRKGPFGVDQINQQIHRFLESKTPYLSSWSYPIMVTQNDPEKNLFNGMIGIVIEPKKGLSEKKVYFQIGGTIKEFSLVSMPSYDLAYALSVHKSQGSEYDTVFLLFPPETKITGKEVFYTAATRAKKELWIWGEKPQILESLRISLNRISGRQIVT